MISYRVTFTTSKGYIHTDTFKNWREARYAYALAVKTHGAATFTEEPD